MAVTPPVAQGVRVFVRYTWAGQQMENVFGYRHAAPVTSSQLAAMASAWWTVNGAKYQALLPPDVTIIEVRAKDARSTGFIAEGVYSLPANTHGTGPGSVTAPNSAIRLLLRTAGAGPSYRGAKSIGPVPSVWQTQGTISSAGVTALLSFAAQLLTPILTDFFLGVLSEKLGSTFDVLSVELLNNFLDSQKTRLLEHGA